MYLYWDLYLDLYYVLDLYLCLNTVNKENPWWTTDQKAHR